MPSSSSILSACYPISSDALSAEATAARPCMCCGRAALISSDALSAEATAARPCRCCGHAANQCSCSPRTPERSVFALVCRPQVHTSARPGVGVLQCGGCSALLRGRDLGGRDDVGAVCARGAHRDAGRRSGCACGAGMATGRRAGLATGHPRRCGHRAMCRCGHSSPH
eukprot:365071-Chlamydomonas_euryale.AAC.1